MSYHYAANSGSLGATARPSPVGSRQLLLFSRERALWRQFVGRRLSLSARQAPASGQCKSACQPTGRPSSSGRPSKVDHDGGARKQVNQSTLWPPLPPCSPLSQPAAASRGGGAALLAAAVGAPEVGQTTGERGERPTSACRLRSHRKHVDGRDDSPLRARC